MSPSFSSKWVVLAIWLSLCDMVRHAAKYGFHGATWCGMVINYMVGLTPWCDMLLSTVFIMWSWCDMVRHAVKYSFHYVISCIVRLTLIWEHKFMHPLYSQGFWMEGFFLSSLPWGTFVLEIADGLLFWRTSIVSRYSFIKTLVIIFLFRVFVWMWCCLLFLIGEAFLAFFNWRTFSLVFQRQVAFFVQLRCRQMHTTFKDKLTAFCCSWLKEPDKCLLFCCPPTKALTYLTCTWYSNRRREELDIPMWESSSEVRIFYIFFFL